MSKTTERSRFENRFTENVIEVAAVTGASGAGAGKGGRDIMWNASINLIAWKSLHSNEPVMKEELRLEWLVDDKEWEQSRDILKMNTVVKLQVRRAEKSMMLVKVLETAYRDDELEMILQESMKPVFYNDEVLGKFELEKSVKLFEKEIFWAGEEGTLYFDWDEDENTMKSALETAHTLFKVQDEWNQKIRKYASEELVELANDWLQDNDEAEIDEITKEMFMNFMELSSISVYPDGDFEMFFFDGDMFWGHSIIVNGNINGDLASAEIAG
ncbi:DUF2262 domain-containing protein [Cytobacillus dafuensis]|uniref:DUF2262 domain-containing protein n=1 Tax=Cytobacillus dafuensis TaxID=1742359 RepID=A0A5B8Z1N1_CYTDA|nr:DUF2262 domain-containing protein [Cytobacillus dafuensis]QED46920.1 DUF2262 domain-containing protein [Cytobacillus dafuensis]